VSNTSGASNAIAFLDGVGVTGEFACKYSSITVCKVAGVFFASFTFVGAG